MACCNSGCSRSRTDGGSRICGKVDRVASRCAHVSNAFLLLFSMERRHFLPWYAKDACYFFSGFIPGFYGADSSVDRGYVGDRPAAYVSGFSLPIHQIIKHSRVQIGP